MNQPVSKTRALLYILPLLVLIGIAAAHFWLRPLLNPTPQDQQSLTAAEGCLLGVEACRVDLPGGWVSIRGPEQILPMRDFDLILESNLPLQGDEVSYVMPGMDMGMNRFALQHQGNHWVAPSALAMCMSGRLDWVAQVRFSYGGQAYEVSVPLLMTRP